MLDSNGIRRQEIHQVSLNGDIEKLKLLLKNNPQLINANGWMGEKPLHCAACSNSPECVELLIEKGADVNARNGNGATAIFNASRVDIAKILVENGASLDIVARYNSTALRRAIACQHTDVVRYLISQGADINYVAKLDFKETMTESALSQIIQKSQPEKKDKALEILEILLEAGADPNIQNVYGSTALHTASLRGLTDFVELLLQYGADPCIRNVGKKNSFDLAANYPDILELFEPYRANLKPLVEIQDSPEKLIERLLKIGFVERSQLIPCSEAEIADLEARNRVKLPESYKKFLRIMGKGAGHFLKSDHWEIFYSDFDDWLGVDFYKIPEAEYQEYTQAEIDFSLSIPSNFFVFATRLGDFPLGFFADGKDDDPDIYLWEHESEIKFWGKTFWKFFQEMVEYYEFHCDPNKFSKTAVPWSANYSKS
ncbi:MAG: ankyrin repeat domain-containing protein [Cyanobacteria bacterium P01_G01_bin.19]